MKTSIIALSIALLTASGSFAQQVSAGAEAASAVEMQGQIGEMLFAQARTEAQVIAALELQGYEISDTRRSLLGRVIITAQNDIHVREIVMSRATGEILSDQVVDLMASVRARTNGATTANDESGSASTGTSVGSRVDLNVSVGRDNEDENNRAGSVSIGGAGGISIGLGN